MLCRSAARLTRCGSSLLCRSGASAEPLFASTGVSLFSSAAATSLTTSSPVTELYDVVIVGGGMIGATMACALHTSEIGAGLRILALDGAKAPPTPSVFASVPPAAELAAACSPSPAACAEVAAKLPTPTLRTVALSPKSADLLESVGVWAPLRATNRVGAYDRMFVWDSHATAGNGADVAEAGAASDMFGASVEWRASDAAVFGTDDHASHASGSSGASTVESLGYVVENDLLHSHVFARLQELSAASKTRAATATAAATGTTAAAAEDGAAPVPVMNPVWLSYYANTGTVEALSSTGVSAIALPPAATVVPTASAPAPAAEAAEAAAASAGPEGSGVTSRFARLSLADGRTVAARLVIGADGQSSLVKSAAGLDAVGWDYPHRASVATVQLDRPLTTAYQRFLPSGPVALLPLYGPLANVVWSSGHAHAKHLIACAEEEYLRQLTAALFTPAADLAPLAQRSGIRVEGPLNAWGLPELSPASLLKHVASLPDKVASFWRNPLPPSLRSAAKHLRSPPSLLNLPSNGATAGDAEPTCEMPPRPVAVRGPRAGFPLKLSLGIEYVNPRVAIIGDAAHVTHPLAGQGVNLGFGDVAALTKELVAGVGAGADIGDYHVLKNYQAKQLPVNAAGLLGVDFIAKTFGAGVGPVALARTLGVGLVDATPAMKRLAARFAMGTDRGN